MNLAQLIAAAARDAIAERPGVIGVSFSPLTITPQELERVPVEVHKLLTNKAYVAASAPRVKSRKAERVLVASDESAAEQATAWRNVVRPGEGEHLVYVSVEEHAKASGLRDCLVAVSEAQLVNTLLTYLDSAESGLPKGLADALRASGLHETRSLATLSAFVVAARKEALKAKPWAAVAQSLPTLGLVRDSGLSADSAALRLGANERLVSAALTGDVRRRATRSATADLEDRLRSELRGRPASIRPGVFARMDMKEVATPRLKAVAKPKVSSLPPPSPGERSPSKKETPAAAPAGKGSTKRGSTEREPPRKSPREQPEPQPSEPGQRERAGRHRLHAQSLPSGLAALLAALHGGEGGPARVSLKGGGRALLAASIRPDQLQLSRAPKLEQHCPDVLGRWSAARRELLALIESLARADDVAPLLVHSFSRLCEIEALRAALARLADAGAALYASAQRAGSAACLEALRADTIEIYGGGRIELRLFGPLHMLSLGQAMARAQRGDAAASLSGAARELVRSALTASLAAPQVLPEGADGELLLARPEHGLITYERAPEAVVGEPVTLLAQALVRRYTELSPHASLGLRIALFDGDEAAFVRGLERALETNSDLRRIELLSRRPPRLEQDPARDDLLATGRLSIDGLPLGEAGLVEAAPHIVVRFVSGESLPREREPAPPRAVRPAAGEQASSFERLENALRVSTPLQDPGSLAFEQLYATIRERQARGAFVSEHAALALRSVAPTHPVTPVTWHAVVAPSLGRRPSLGYNLIAHDQVDVAQCVILSQELRPLTRGLQQGLARLGMREPRPSVLKGLATMLSSVTSSPLSSLWRRSELQLLAGLLALELTRQSNGERLIVPIAPESLKGLLDADAKYEQEVLMLALLVEDGELVPTIGIATADAQADVELTGTALGGKVGALSEALSTIWRLAARGTGPEGAAALELLSWMVWPALAAEERGPDELEPALRERKLRAAPPALVLLAPPSLTSVLPSPKKSRVSVRSLDPTQLNTLLLR